MTMSFIGQLASVCCFVFGLNTSTPTQHVEEKKTVTIDLTVAEIEALVEAAYDDFDAQDTVEITSPYTMEFEDLTHGANDYQVTSSDLADIKSLLIAKLISSGRYTSGTSASLATDVVFTGDVTVGFDTITETFEVAINWARNPGEGGSTPTITAAGSIFVTR